MIGDGNRSAVPRPLPPSPVIGRGAGGEGPLITSSWRVRTLVPRTLERLTGAAIAVPEDEAELRAMLSAAGLDVCAPGDSRARVLLAGRATWERGDWSPVEAALTRGTGAVLLDIGPRELGQGYLEGGDLGPLQGAMHIAQPATVDVPLFWGLTARFREMPEPESCLHPAPDDDSLWAGLDRQATWLWNGYRGGLIVPARDLELVGLSPDAFLALWAGRGADTRAIQAGGAVGYELAGFYAFSDGRSDAVRDDLRRRVQFLVDDAPALAAAINPNAPIAEHDLSTEYRHSTGRATALIPLANAGKNLARTPVAAVRFGAGEGTLVVSQLLTQGRLAPGFGTPGLYGIRHDPAAVQVVLNMLARAAAP